MPSRPRGADVWQINAWLRILEAPNTGARRLVATRPPRVDAFATETLPSESSPRRGAPSSASALFRGIGHVREISARFASRRVEEILRRSGRKLDGARFAPSSDGETLAAAVTALRGSRLAETAICEHRPADGIDRRDMRHSAAKAVCACRSAGWEPDELAREPIRLARAEHGLGCIDRLRPSSASRRAGGALVAGPRSSLPCRRAGRRHPDRNIVAHDELLDAALGGPECGAHPGQEEGDELQRTDAVDDPPFRTNGENGRKVLVAGVGPGA